MSGYACLASNLFCCQQDARISHFGYPRPGLGSMEVIVGPLRHMNSLQARRTGCISGCATRNTVLQPPFDCPAAQNCPILYLYPYIPLYHKTSGRTMPREATILLGGSSLVLWRPVLCCFHFPALSLIPLKLESFLGCKCVKLIFREWTPGPLL